MSRSKLFIIISAILLLAASCNKQAAVQPVQNQPNPPANLKTYTNTQYRFSFQYPDNFSVKFSSLPSTDKTKACVSSFTVAAEQVNGSMSGCIFTDSSLIAAKNVCVKDGGECSAYPTISPQSPCANSTGFCNDYAGHVGSGDWVKEAIFNNKTNQYHVFLETRCLFTCYPDNYQGTIVEPGQALTDLSAQKIIQEGKLSKANQESIDLLNTAYSSFKFTK